MFEYTFDKSNGEIEILTPFVNDIKDIKKETTQTASCIHDVSTFPNGVILDMEQYYDKIIVKCTNELVNNNDGTYSIIL
ncbi:hypothetical protein DVV91_09800 [Clostridium botulinum]|uniref:hypothetical protein n=1 Tax=Clostridium botulinum TaxID=1491 RepID=UPI0019674C66|nr:hypothetical protein [Clostridium botulinum]MBN1074633.1 hypothetical protein [Clostridium botulinum]